MASNVLDAKANPLRATSSIDYNAYLELSRVKNRAGILLIFWPFAWGLVMSAKTLNLPLDVVLRFLGWGMIGSFLLHSAGCIWDDIVDRNLDAQVGKSPTPLPFASAIPSSSPMIERTKKRPLPSGRVSVRGALVWMTVNIIPLLALILPSNPLARTIGLVSVFPLAGLYPFMKRVTYWPQAWLGLTLNTGVVAAWAYTSGSYPMSALVLSGGAWAWTLWYDTIYACQDRKDDLKAGIKSTAVLFASRTKLAIALFGLILISALYAAGVLNNQGYAYFVVSVGGATADLIMQLSEIDFERTESCGRALEFSLLLLLEPERPMTSSDDGLNERPDDDTPIITLRSAAKDIAIGSIAGMVSEVFEYPFDLAKVRLQSQLLTASSTSTLRFNGPVDCLKQTFRDEGVRGLYRGLPVPIVGTMAETAILFFAYTSFQNLIKKYTGSSSKLTATQFAIAGGCAGATASFVLTPIELIKCKMQVQMMSASASAPSASAAPAFSPRAPSYPSPSSGFSSSSQPIMASPPRNTRSHTTAFTPKYPGAISLLRTTVRTHGISGLWLGHTGTLLREGGGNAAWFAVKETIAAALIRRRLRKHNKSLPPSSSPSIAAAGATPRPPRPPLTSSQRRHGADILPWESAVSGAVAGACGTVVSYPADTVKSAMQTSEEIRAGRPHLSAGVSPSPAGFVATFKRMYATHGVRGMYAGCGMTAVKAVPISGILFVVYDGLNSLVDKYFVV
ncbi:hypothetical protein EYR38_002688 [Pleurotus pulmonarius]|nr:hypothetical protein EYR38_002688 [Pleurotus pulmonarius]